MTSEFREAGVAKRHGWRLRLVACAAVVALAPLVPGPEAHATPFLAGIDALNAAGDHTCGLAAGAAVCWGANAWGEVGDGSKVDRTLPTFVTTSTGMTAPVSSIVLGFHHTCAIAGGGAWCWGLNDHGEIGNGFASNTVGVLKPSNVSGLSSGVTQLALGGQHTCALLSTGAVKCWGRNDVGQLGTGGLFDSELTPAQVSGLTSGVVAIAAAQKHTCALISGGTVKCWGQNTHGAVGDNTVIDKKVPTAVSGLSGVTAISVGGDHACALTGGGVKCWGFNSSGQLGNGTTADALTPVNANGLTSGVAAIAAGGAHTCALTVAGVLECWGLNSNGQLGDGTTSNRTTPVDVPTGGVTVSSVVTGRRHSCLKMSPSGGSKCWGLNADGQVGSGSVRDLHGPFLPDPPPRPTATAGNTKATVSWAAPASDGGFAITSYTIASTPATPLVNVSAGTHSTTITGLHNGTQYTFVVRATNSIGVGGDSAASNAVTPAGLPGSPTQLSVATADRAATVSWHAAAPNGSALTSNRVTVSPGGHVVTTSGSATSARITGLSNGATYTFSVRATNHVGNGPSASITRTLPSPRSGYWMLGANGSVYAFGSSQALGSASYPSWPTGVSAVAIAPRLDGKGYWVVDDAGGVHAFGSAHFYGDRPSLRAGERVATIAATPTSRGYYLFTNRGRAIVYGDAKFLGDMSRVALNGPVIASNATPTGRGYYMVASDGGVFSFGDARFHGSTGGIRLNQPVVGLSPTPSNGGYWLVASDGGVFAFGDASFRGSMGAVHLNKPVNGLVPFGNGYLMVASDGGAFVFSNKPFYGSLAATPPPAPIIGIAAFVS